MRRLLARSLNPICETESLLYWQWILIEGNVQIKLAGNQSHSPNYTVIFLIFVMAHPDLSGCHSQL